VTKYYAAVSGRRSRKKKQGWVKGMMTSGRRGSYKLVNSSSKQRHTTRHDKEEGGEEEGSGDENSGSIGDSNSSNSGNNAKKRGGYAATRFFTAGLGNLSPSPLLLGGRRNEESDGGGDGGRAYPRTAILFRPHTGRTHQLRVAAKSLGVPILGDGRYGGGRLDSDASAGGRDVSEEDEDASAEDDWDRTYLHASAIHLRLDDGEGVAIWSPPPFDRLFSPAELGDVFVGMMEKHCDCPEILEAMRGGRAQIM